MPLFTIVLDHRGGTYISQFKAPSARAALRSWAHAVPRLGIPGIGGARAALFLTELESPVQVNGVRQVWCRSAIIAGHLALFNIVATAASSVAPSRRRARATHSRARAAAG
jgi:hypothetical protein